MGQDGSKLSRHHHHRNSKSTSSNGVNQQHSKDDDDIELPKPQRRMDKIRRSLSFRKKKNKHKSDQPLSQSSQPTTSITQPIPPPQSTTSIANSTISQAQQTSQNSMSSTSIQQQDNKYQIDSSKPTSWQEDERKVRDGNCSFHVKYLGSIEVLDSRGMHICEQAIERLLAVSVIKLTYLITAQGKFSCFFFFIKAKEKAN